MNFLSSDEEEAVSDAESSTSLHQLTVNETYAKAFAYKKEREELAKLKEKYGSDYEGSDAGSGSDSESETEDEDGEELTPAVDAAILRTLARIQKKDPVIYESSKGVFEEEAKRIEASAPWGYKAKDSKDKSKPLTIKQQNMQSLLQPSSRSPSPTIQTHAEEQAALRSETISAFHSAVQEKDSDADSEDELAGGLLQLREKTQDELERQEEEYRAYLERQVGDVRSLVQAESDTVVVKDEPSTSAASGVGDGKGKGTGKSKKRARKEETDQEFLLNYIFNRGWIDRESRHLPTYSDVTGRASGSILPSSSTAASKSKSSKPSKSKSGQEPVGDEAVTEDGEEGVEEPDVEELEEFDDLADVFESTYNFRFEEPGAATIQSHPRNVESTVRREDTTRKEARERRKARKAEELAKKNEEVKRLKALKLREMRKKLGVIGREGGLGEEELQELDLEGEWDAEKHDKQMSALYEGLEGDDLPEEDADGKPVWDDDIDIGDIPIPSDFEAGPSSSSMYPTKSKPAEPEKKSKKQLKKEARKKAKAAAQAAEDGVDIDMMDADALPAEREWDEGDGGEGEEWDGTEEMRKRKLDEYMNELYGLEFNDITAGLPTRFKYAPVAKSSFALSSAEILMATDAELNEYVGLKKLAPYRKGKRREDWDPKGAEKLREFRGKVSDRTGGWSAPNGNGERRVAGGEEGEKKKRKGKKERMRAKMVEDGGAPVEASGVALEPTNANGKRPRDEEVAAPAATANGQDHDTQQSKKRKKKKRSHDSAQEA